MNNNKENDFYRKKGREKESANSVTEDVVYNELFIRKSIKPRQ